MEVQGDEFEWTGNGPGMDLDLSLTITNVGTRAACFYDY